MYHLLMLANQYQVEPNLPHYKSSVGNAVGLIMPEIVRTRPVGSCITPQIYAALDG